MLSAWVVPGLDPDIKTIKPIFLDVCYSVIEEETGVTKDQVQSGVPKRPYVDAKKIISQVLRMYTRLRLVDIANEFNVDHSSIVHYGKNFDILLDYEPDFKKLYDKVVASLIEKQLI